ncbi:MAG: tetratricopeptide repeat protein [Pseudomonadota bacterium]
MANEDSVLREVDQELAEDKQWLLFSKYGPAAIGAGAAIIVGVGAWQVWTAMQTRAAGEQAIEFNNAIETLAEDAESGRAELAAIAGGSSGYAVLAEFRRAGSLAADGQTEESIAVFQSVYADSAAPKPLRSLARLRASYLSLDQGREAALGHLGDLSEAQGPFSHHADEVIGVAALRAEDYQTAISIFDRLKAAPATPEPLRIRATELRALAVAGQNGVNITGDIRIDDILGAVAPGDNPLFADPSAANQLISDALEAAAANAQSADDAAEEAIDEAETEPVSEDPPPNESDTQE